MLLPPPRTALFPYTTLFRSARRQGCPRAAARLACVKHAASVQSEPGSNSPLNLKVRLRDRKSTRLNSSHVEISYAVFCLKKKTALSDLDQQLMHFPQIKLAS